MNPQALHPPLAVPASTARGVWRQLAAAALLGGVVFYGVSFVDLPMAHNAAHDVRHVTVRPCH